MLFEHPEIFFFFPLGMQKHIESVCFLEPCMQGEYLRGHNMRHSTEQQM